MPLTIRDHNVPTIDAIRSAFTSFPEVTIEVGDIFERPAWALVSPANCFGFMNGGIDAVYVERFGAQIERSVQSHIHGFCPIGKLHVISTGDKDFPRLVVLPTMIGPSRIAGTTNVFTAFHCLVAAMKNSYWGEVVCPSLGTGCGQMPPAQAARQMAAAYAIATKQQFNLDFDLETSVGAAKFAAWLVE